MSERTNEPELIYAAYGNCMCALWLCLVYSIIREATVTICRPNYSSGVVYHSRWAMLTSLSDVPETSQV
jgi:hypothetical protein